MKAHEDDTSSKEKEKLSTYDLDLFLDAQEDRKLINSNSKTKSKDIKDDDLDLYIKEPPLAPRSADNSVRDSGRVDSSGRRVEPGNRPRSFTKRKEITVNTVTEQEDHDVELFGQRGGAGDLDLDEIKNYNPPSTRNIALLKEQEGRGLLDSRTLVVDGGSVSERKREQELDSSKLKKYKS